MLRLNHTALHKIKLHAMQTYPEECCGVLLGRERGASKLICDVLEMKNARQEERTHRFLIPPDEYTRAEETARRQHAEVIGFYHSHPDHPATPSEFDAEHALPVCSYLIVGIDGGLPMHVTSWVLKDDRSGFETEEIEVLDGEFKHRCV